MQKHTRVYRKFFRLGEQDVPLCEICHAIATDVHHIIYRSQGGTDEIENLIGLCRMCHDRAHFKKMPYLEASKLQEVHNRNIDFVRGQ